MASHPEAQPRHLVQEEQQLLTKHANLDKNELNEVDSGTFTPLDAHYLELAFLLRDAIRGLNLDGLGPQARVAKGFDWVTRQVRLQPGDAITVPPLLVLRRGFGTARERDLVFLALLDQLGMDGCMVAVPAAGPDQAQLRDWVPGALIDKDIYLFDSRLGLPLPGPDGKDIATLAQVRAGLPIGQILQVQEKYPYDVSPDRARQAQVRVAFSLSSLAPRMEYLQHYIAGSEKIRLWIDPVARFQRFQSVEATAQIWSSAAEPSDSLHVLRAFLTPEEGGVATKPYRNLVRLQVVPLDYFPPQLRLPGEPGQKLQTLFVAPFVYFGTEVRMPSDLLMSWLPGRSEASVDKPGTRRPSENLVRSPLPRDLMLHGRLDDAAKLLVIIREEIERQKALPVTPKLEEAARQWSERVIGAYSDLIRVEEEAKKQGGASSGAAAEANERVNQLWGAERAPAMILLQKSAALPMLERVVYLLALCKQEQAERLQIQREHAASSATDAKAAEDAWKSAANWWASYLNDYASWPAAPAARLLRARALQTLGNRQAAVTLLEDLAGISNDLEKATHLYLAKQLKPQ